GGLVNKIFIFYEDICKIPRSCRRKGWVSNLFDSNSGKTLPSVSKLAIKTYLVFLNYCAHSKAFTGIFYGETACNPLYLEMNHGLWNDNDVVTIEDDLVWRDTESLSVQ
ncbi:MAG: hypothetical protein FWD31_10680, partial [Planctomycetaceae bacterium]|nr:hypothetical protein [Planctomycetaceae bacterium]